MRKNNIFCALLRYINQLSFNCSGTPPPNPLGMLPAYFPSVLIWVTELHAHPRSESALNDAVKHRDRRDTKLLNVHHRMPRPLGWPHAPHLCPMAFTMRSAQ